MFRLERWLATAGLLALLVGCAPVTATPAGESGPLLLETATPTDKPPVTPSATPPLCPAPAEVTLPERPGDFPQAYIATLTEYLSAGGAVAALPQLLTDWDVLPPEGQPVATGDFTGNGTTETVVAFINPQAQQYPPAAALVIFHCKDGTVRRLYTLTGTPLYLIGLQDLTGDVVADVAFAEIACSEVTCWHTAHVWSWAGSDVQARISGTFSLPYADFTLDEGAILGTTYGLGSVDAGPQRPYTETWAWQGTTITYTGEMVGPPIYRYQVFREGDEALYAKDYDAAFDAYVRVLRDETLQSWASAVDATAERRWLEALAQWRLLSMGMQLGNFPDAEARYQALQENWGPGEPGYPVVQVADRFWAGYLETGNVAYGCLDAVNVPVTGEVLTFLNSFGYANPTYTAEELCPFLTP